MNSHTLLNASHFSANDLGEKAWKDRIDRKWMDKYKVLPEMVAAEPQLSDIAKAAGQDAIAAIKAVPMRCGGCG